MVSLTERFVENEPLWKPCLWKVEYIQYEYALESTKDFVKVAATECVFYQNSNALKQLIIHANCLTDRFANYIQLSCKFSPPTSHFYSK